ncbi:50S ribosomal protein L6 [Tepidiforma flava]|uniref:Large ribosomal subunit protein uL6 n=1 Tax=Tepidiforma flava TaxID=3004094 RepID=A0ABY7M7X3_9CHLR|nr:50S ribosomal protein L6 [Tepidiforma flava]WBL36636.1 50S ribosomal protein L6 [Tepidiforma flava]
MSRIGRQPIPVPPNVTITIDEHNNVVVKGPKGELSRQFPPRVSFERQDGVITVRRASDDGEDRALHGLSRTLLANMVTGVTSGFTKVLEVQGVGYRAQLQGSNLQLALGFSHPVIVNPPEGIKFSVEGPRITVEGIDKERVGQVAANIRKIRPPEPYKGKGIRYLGERVRRKAGKSGKVGKK